MLVIVITCLLLLIITTLIHFEVLRLLSSKLPKMSIQPRNKLIVVILGAFTAHGFEIVLYGLIFYVFTHFFSFGSLSGAGGLSVMGCIYFSTETYTSLGFGDIIPGGSLRLMAGIETLNGLLLIGWSASYLYLAMERYWQAPESPR